MKILAIGLNYTPDLIGVAKYTTELCEELAARGHQLEVITAPPYYPNWEIPFAYSNGRRRRETLNGVLIQRTRLYVPKTPSGLKRLIHLASFAAAALPLAIRRARAIRPDIVFTVAPALFSAPVALAAARLSGARSWLHIQDFELDAAFELGLLKDAAARRLGERLERTLLGAFDRVSTISPNMLRLLEAKGVPPTRALEIRNWVDVDEIKTQVSTATAYRAELGISAQAPVLLYSGNISGKQSLHTVADALLLLARRRPDIVTIFCGNGPYRAELEQRCAGLDSVRFIDLQPKERFSELLATADVHLLPQKRGAADLVLPSKLAGMLASGRASIVMADPGTSLAEEVSGAGLAVPPDDVIALADAVIELLGNPVQRAQLGAGARRKAETLWRRSSIIDKFEAEALA